MHSKVLVTLLPVLAALGASAAPYYKREVPQEHSHESILTVVRASLALNNPQGIVDPVFGLLGNAAAAAGLGKTTDPDCLQQATADQAFTNAKAKNDVAGMTAALTYRALERNTGKVGLASVACTSVKAVNPEIAAIQQHQDPASSGAAQINKEIVLTLTQQIDAVGGDPLDALKSGTFAPGNLNDNTGKGNTCDTTDDPLGCIFSQNLLVDDATPAEISAAVSGETVAATTTAAAAVATATATATAAAVDDSVSCTSSTVTVTVGASAATATAIAAVTSAAASWATATAAASGKNLQTFSGALNGIPPIPVTAGGKGFLVDGTSDINLKAALQRSCDVQKNACANAANSGKGTSSVSDCENQHDQCIQAGQQ